MHGLAVKNWARPFLYGAENNNMSKGKLLITGSNGFLGSNLVNHFLQNDYEVYGSDLQPVSLRGTQISYISGDLTDQKFANELVSKLKPDCVINTVALVDLNICENDATKAYQINVLTAKNIAQATGQKGIRLVHISTDHFFNGSKSYYSEDDIPNPVNNYGKTKLEAEKECLNNNPNTTVIRTNFYGWSSNAHKLTFGEWLYESLYYKKPINLFTDYYFSPIEVTALAEAVELVMKSEFKGVINIAGSERCSKYEFGMALAEIFGLDTSTVSPAKMKPDSFSVSRQPDLSLSTERFKQTFKKQLPSLRAGLQRFLANKPGEIKR